MNLLHDWWPHIATAISALIAGLNYKRVFSGLKWVLENIQPEKIKALEMHEKHDDQRFDDMKGSVKDSEVRVIEAVRENTGFIMKNLSDYKQSNDNRLVMLEKVFLDERLK